MIKVYLNILVKLFHTTRMLLEPLVASALSPGLEIGDREDRNISELVSDGKYSKYAPSKTSDRTKSKSKR